MKQFTRLFLKKIDEQELVEHMKYVFDPSCMLHNYHYEDTNSELKIVRRNSGINSQNKIYELYFSSVLILPNSHILIFI